MSVEDDLEILKKFAGEPETQAASAGEDAVSGALDLEDLIATCEDEPAPQNTPAADDFETLKFKLQKAENTIDEMNVKLATAEKAAEELAYFKHPYFKTLREHVSKGGKIYLLPAGLAKPGREAVYIAAQQSLEIQKHAEQQNYTPIFDVKITDISTQRRTK